MEPIAGGKISSEGARYMKRFMLALVAAAVLTMAIGVAVATADTGSAAPAKGEQMKHRLAAVLEKLDLTPAQKTEVKAILKAAHEKAQNAADPAAKREIFKGAMKKIVTTVLTPAQREKLKELRQEAKNRHHAPNATRGTAA
jgi:Spy/CpxP family protein refolding chaperone